MNLESGKISELPNINLSSLYCLQKKPIAVQWI